MTDPVKIDPVWRQAADDAVHEFDYGEMIPHSWIGEHLEIDPREGKLTIERHRELDFDLLRKMDGFRDALLYEHKRYLVNVRGVGYKIIEPPHQTTAAMRALSRDMRRSIAKAMSALVNIDETALQLDDARENAEARARVAWLNTVGAKRLESNGDKEGEPQ